MLHKIVRISHVLRSAALDSELGHGGNVTAEVHMPRSEYVRDFEDDNLARAFPLQFPYGFGGPSEKRTIRRGNRIGVMNKVDYLQHVVNLAPLPFQESMFILICYNRYVREKMVQSAYLKVKLSDKQ